MIRKQQGRYHLEDIDGDDEDEEDNNANEEVVEDGGIIFGRYEPFYYVLSVDEDMGAAVLLLSDECTVRRPRPR